MTDKLVERVKVAVRLRPLIEDELIAKDRSVCIETIDPFKKLLIVKKDFEKRQFQFDCVFDPKANQSFVYNEIAHGVVESVLRGFNGTIFCYGQTGTGKTYTMMGQADTEDRGIIPRTFEQIFNEISADNFNRYTVQIGYLQIYMEMLLDLIRPDNQEIKIRECPDSGVFVSGLEWVNVDSVSECMTIINYAEKNKMVAFTSLNAHSSRSHSMLLVKIDRKTLQCQSHSRSMTISKKPSIKSQNNYSQDMLPTDSYYEEMHINQSSQSTGNLYLVDLAGSERIKKSRATGDRLSEARSINYSLTALGKCIHALTGPKSTFVPFRDSKLTRILQDSLGGNCKTALIVNIGPAGRHVEETLSSLTFGMRAMKVTNTPQINVNKDYEAISLQLQQELENKDEQIAQLEKSQIKLLQQVSQLTKDLNEMKTNSSLIMETDGNESHYKQLLEKAEQEHKAFLEEIDNMMVEQEQENEELKKRLNDKDHQLEELQNRLHELEQELEQNQDNKQEMEATIQDLQAMVDQKEKQMLKERKDQNNGQKENINFDVINKQKEKQNQIWRQELSELTNEYSHLLEDKKRLELNVQQLQQTQQQLQQQNQQYQQLMSQNGYQRQSKVEYQSSQINEQNFELELKQSIAVSGVHEGHILMELQAKMQQYEAQLEIICQESDEKDELIKGLSSKLQQVQQEAEQQKQQLQLFSQKSQLSLQKMEDTMVSEVIKSTMEKMILQIEINSLEMMQDDNDTSSKAQDSDLKLNMRSFSKHDNNSQLVESLFINSRRSQQQAIQECDDEDSDANSEINYQLPKFTVSGSKMIKQKSNSRQDSVFSFSEKQQPKKEIISLYDDDDLSEINQKSDRDSMKNSTEEISFQINFNDANAVDKFLTQIKQRQSKLNQQQDLSIGSIQQAQSPLVSDQKVQNRELEKVDEKQHNQDLQEVIKVMANMLVEKNQNEFQTTKATLRASMLDFNNLCNTFTTYFL